jgi:hypothetical protein
MQPTLGLAVKNMMAAGAKIRDMELESIDSLMELFTKAAGQMTIEMASALSGFLMATSFKEIIRIINVMVSK